MRHATTASHFFPENLNTKRKQQKKSESPPPSGLTTQKETHIQILPVPEGGGERRTASDRHVIKMRNVGPIMRKWKRMAGWLDVFVSVCVCM